MMSKHTVRKRVICAADTRLGLKSGSPYVQKKSVFLTVGLIHPSSFVTEVVSVNTLAPSIDKLLPKQHTFPRDGFD